MVDIANQPTDLVEVLRAADELAAADRYRDAVDLLAAAERRTPDARLASRLVGLRHEAVGPAGELNRRAAAHPPIRAYPAPADPGIPEVDRDGLTAEVLGSALQHRGSVLVRGWLSADVAGELREQVAKALSVGGAAMAEGRASDPPWFERFEPHESYDVEGFGRVFTHWVQSLLTVDSPRALARVVDAMRDAGTGELLQEYLGEWPVLSAKKSTLRRAYGSSPNGWHQDGAFLGPYTKTVNTWIALTPCGVDAPSIDMVVHGFDEIVETGTDDARFDWSVGDAVIERLGLRVERPVFEPGDALFFNQMSLHRSGIEPTMTGERVAIESWFFAPSTCPSEQIPLLF